MTNPPITDYTHAEGCNGCTFDDEGDSRHCHGCGHWRVDVGDYSHGYYCTDCCLAIEHWRKADADMTNT
jgi:hypothetical protein